MTNTVTSEKVDILGVQTQIDTNGNFYGYAFRFQDRLYTQGGFTKRFGATTAARKAIARLQESARQENLRRLTFARW